MWPSDLWIIGQKAFGGRAYLNVNRHGWRHFRRFARMIARVCSGFIIYDRIEEFLVILRDEILPAYTSADGILSVLVLRRTLVGYHEVMVLSLWESRQAVAD